LVLEETVDHLAKGGDGLGTFEERRLERALRTRFADEETRCAGNPGLCARRSVLVDRLGIRALVQTRVEGVRI
jgi:hypothetical protein